MDSSSDDDESSQDGSENDNQNKSVVSSYVGSSIQTPLKRNEPNSALKAIKEEPENFN